MSGWLVAVGTIGLSVSLIVPNFLSVRSLGDHYLFRNEIGSLSGFVQQNIVGQSLVKSYNLDTKAQSDFRHRANRVLSAGVKSYYSSFLVHRTPSLLFLVFSLAMLGAGTVLTMNGHLSLGEFVAVQTLFMGLSHGVDSVACLMSSVIDTAAAYGACATCLTRRLMNLTRLERSRCRGWWTGSNSTVSYTAMASVTRPDSSASPQPSRPANT